MRHPRPYYIAARRHASLGQLDTLANLAQQITTDPGAQEAMLLIADIVNEEDQAGGGGGGAGGGGGGTFQLSSLTPWLKTYLFFRRNPWVLPVGGTVAFLGIFGLGYAVGAKKRKAS